MKTAREFFKEEYSEHNSMTYYPPSEIRIAEIMEAYAKYYHEQQVKSVDVDEVSNCKFSKEDYAMEAMKMLIRTENYTNHRIGKSVSETAWSIADEMFYNYWLRTEKQ